jgi:hypothetical protein
MRSDKLLGTLVGASFAIAALSYCGGVAPSSADGPDAGKTSCDCPVAPAAVVKSGTRLKARVRTSPDGASQFLGWFDSQLKGPCGYMDPGNTNAYLRRCVPDAMGQTDGAHFADPSCAGAASFVHASAAADTHFCWRNREVVRLGSAISNVYARDVEGVCVEAHDAFTQTTGATFFACDGESVAPETFVLMTDSVD